MEETIFKTRVFSAASSETENVSEFVRENLPETTEKKIVNRINIVLDELFSNVIKYSESKECIIGVGKDGEEGSIVICLEYGGIIYDVTKTEKPDTTLSAEDREIGGLGLFMAMNLSKSLEYKTENDKNIIIIKF